MKKLNRISIFVCGLLLTLAALPVAAQMNEAKARVINRKPLQDFVAYLNEKAGDGKTDLNAAFTVRLEGVLDERGKFDSRKSKFVESEGDARLTDIAKSFIEALGESGIFIYLRQSGAEKINLTLAQNDSLLYSDIVLEQASAEKAKTFAAGFNTLIKVVRMADETGMKKLDENSRLLLGGVSVVSEGTSAVIKFAVQKNAVQDLINKNLKRQ